MRLLQVGRLSVKKKDGSQTGMESQDKAAENLADREGHDIVARVAEYEKGPSNPFEREELGPYLTDPVLIAQYDGIIAAKADRLVRKLTYAIELRNWCRKNGKTLIICDPDLRWPPPKSNKLMGFIWTILDMFAEMEWQATSSRYRSAQAWLKSEHFVTNKPPFGFDVVKPDGAKHKTLKPNKTERMYIPGLFERCRDGGSLDTLARWLDSSGAETRAHRTWWLTDAGTRGPEPENKWWPNTVANIIRNPVYRGRWCEYARIEDTDPESDTFGEMVIPDPSRYGAVIMEVEALVSPALWQAANDALHTRGRRKPRSAEPAMLSGRVLSCLGCGSPMYRLNEAYYRCAGRGPQREGCNQLVPMAAVDEAVDWAMRADTDHVMVRKVTRGQDWSDEKALVQGDLERLPATARSRRWSRDEEDAERARLRGLQDELEVRETTPDTVELVDTGRTYADEWAAQPGNLERSARLEKLGISVAAGSGKVEITRPGKTVSTGITAPAKARGSHHGGAKLTETIVRECRARYAAGETQAALAAEFGVSAQAMSKAIRSLHWQHVNGETEGLSKRLARPAVSKLTADIVRECRTRHAAGETGKALAAEFGVTSAAMSLAIRGVNWRHVS
jgi:DNA invertase Pin-like site-specific DNA recombinase